jgi:hypothetical protein
MGDSKAGLSDYTQAAAGFVEKRRALPSGEARHVGGDAAVFMLTG